MKVLEIPYADNLPDSVRMSVPEFEQELKMALAAKLFELGRIPSGQAAALAGLARIVFMKNLSRLNARSVDWDADEFTQEITNA